MPLPLSTSNAFHTYNNRSYELQPSISAAISEATCMQAEGAALSLPYYPCKRELQKLYPANGHLKAYL